MKSYFTVLERKPTHDERPVVRGEFEGRPWLVLRGKADLAPRKGLYAPDEQDDRLIAGEITLFICNGRMRDELRRKSTFIGSSYHAGRDVWAVAVAGALDSWEAFERADDVATARYGVFELTDGANLSALRALMTFAQGDRTNVLKKAVQSAVSPSRVARPEVVATVKERSPADQTRRGLPRLALPEGGRLVDQHNDPW